MKVAAKPRTGLGLARAADTIRDLRQYRSGSPVARSRRNGLAAHLDDLTLTQSGGQDPLSLALIASAAHPQRWVQSTSLQVLAPPAAAIGEGVAA